MWTGAVDRIGAGAGVTLGSDFPGPGSTTWRPRPVLLALGGAAEVAAAVWVVLSNSPLDLLVGVVIAIVLGIVLVAGWRRRLVGGPRGLLICGIAGQRIVPWSQVRAVQPATSSRFGLTNTSIEVDLLDDDLLVFGRADLGTDPAEVLAALRKWAP